MLGGIGPESTSIFYARLIGALQRTGLVKTNTDYPQIVINSIPAPELIRDQITAIELEPYKKGLKELDENKCDFIVMVCNTIHLYLEQLQNETTAPIIDLRKKLKEHLDENKIRMVTVLGTPNTIKKGLYKFDGIKYLNPSDGEIEKLSEAIFNFNKGIEKEKQAQTVKAICKKYLDEGSEAIVLGCTELAAMLANAKIAKIDTIDLLVEATIEEFKTLSANSSTPNRRGQC